MKLKSIIIATISIMTMFSCSMENDTIMNDLDKEMSATDKGNVSDAYLVFGIQSNGIATKATDNDNKIGQDITSCSVILYSGNNILAAKDGVKVGDNKVLINQNDSLFFYTKVATGTKVMVIANTKEKYAELPTMEAVKAQVESVESFDASNLLKVGTTDVNFENPYKTVDEINYYRANVTVNQRAALIRLKDIEVTFTGESNPANVSITDVNFLNLNKKTFVAGEYSEDASYSDLTIENETPIYTLNGQNGVVSTTGYEAYSYQNTNTGNSVAVEITYKVGNDIYTTRQFIINGAKVNVEGDTTNGNLVEAGYIYNLNVNMTVKNHKVDVTIGCTVKDWAHNKWEITEE